MIDYYLNILSTVQRTQMTDRSIKSMDNGHKFLIIILLQRETRVAACGTRKRTRSHNYTCVSRLSCSWFVPYYFRAKFDAESIYVRM